MIQTIDTRGHLCPTPLIMAKKAIAAAQAGEELLILSDNTTSCQNLMQYLTDLGAMPCQTNQGNEFHITLKVPEEKHASVSAQTYCTTPASDQKTYVVVIKSDKMGHGDDGLGSILIRAFVNSLKDADRLPTHIILYNTGVKLALKATDTGESLTALHQLGVEIIVCGTCADYFSIKEQLAVGTISNMYQITKITAEAGHVVYP